MSKGPNSKRFSDPSRIKHLSAKDIEAAMRKPLTVKDVKELQVYPGRVVVGDNAPKLTAAFKKYSFGAKKPSFIFKLVPSEQMIVVTKDNVNEVSVMFNALLDVVRNG
jgi:hypothetical protein